MDHIIKFSGNIHMFIYIRSIFYVIYCSFFLFPVYMCQDVDNNLLHRRVPLEA